MKVQITNIANEHIEITTNDIQKFVEVATFDGNIEKCEVFIWDEDGLADKFWLQNAIEEIKERSAEELEEAGDLESALADYFEGHLFADFR
jgi:hypothetical protein